MAINFRMGGVQWIEGSVRLKVFVILVFNLFGYSYPMVFKVVCGYHEG